MRKRLDPVALAALREKRQAGAFQLLNLLHEELGYTRLFIESVAIGQEDYFLRIIIDRNELGSEDVDRLYELTRSFGASLTLRNDHDAFGTRIAVRLPRPEESDADV
jgi:hypothetical protein